jgi:hypothetical protein
VSGGRRFDIASHRLGEGFILGFLQDSTESRHVPIPAKVSDYLPWQASDLGNNDRNDIPVHRHPVSSLKR